VASPAGERDGSARLYGERDGDARLYGERGGPLFPPPVFFFPVSALSTIRRSPPSYLLSPLLSISIPSLSAAGSEGCSSGGGGELERVGRNNLLGSMAWRCH